MLRNVAKIGLALAVLFAVGGLAGSVSAVDSADVSASGDAAGAGLAEVGDSDGTVVAYTTAVGGVAGGAGGAIACGPPCAAGGAVGGSAVGA